MVRCANFVTDAGAKVSVFLFSHCTLLEDSVWRHNAYNEGGREIVDRFKHGLSGPADMLTRKKNLESIHDRYIGLKYNRALGSAPLQRGSHCGILSLAHPSDVTRGLARKFRKTCVD